MSLRQWNTSFERKQLAKITTSLALYQANIGTSEMEEDVMSGSSSSSATSSSVSSSSSSLASDMDLDQTTLIDPVLLKLIVTTTNLNEKINGIVADDGIVWGCTPTIMDLPESDAIANCHLRKILKLICLHVRNFSFFPRARAAFAFLVIVIHSSHLFGHHRHEFNHLHIGLLSGFRVVEEMPPFAPVVLSLKPCVVPFPFQVVAVAAQFLSLCSSPLFSSYLLLIACTLDIAAAFPKASPVYLRFVASLLPLQSRHCSGFVFGCAATFARILPKGQFRSGCLHYIRGFVGRVVLVIDVVLIVIRSRGGIAIPTVA